MHEYVNKLKNDIEGSEIEEPGVHVDIRIPGLGAKDITFDKNDIVEGAD